MSGMITPRGGRGISNDDPHVEALPDYWCKLEKLLLHSKGRFVGMVAEF
jgi:hypothetical protein